MTRLNLGCGDDRREGYVNVDLRPEVADVVGDVRKLPFDDHSVSEILAFDVLEHLVPADSLPTLQEWHRVLERAGTLVLRVPNLYQLARFIVERYMVEAVIVNIYGGHRWGPDGAWDTHHTGWTPELLEALLGRAGFIVRHNDFALNMTVHAEAV